MPRFRKVPSVQVTDLRQADGNGSATVQAGDVTIKPSETGNSPQPTDSAIAPEASPAQTKTTGSKAPSKPKSAKAKASK